MAYDGNGNFNRLYNWQQDAANGINIMADRMDNEMNGFADGLSICLTRDGQAAMEADLDVGNYKVIRVKAPTNDTDAVNKKWVADNYLARVGNPTIEDASPFLFFIETDQISDLNRWRIGVKSTAFAIEPLQSDGSTGNNFGGFFINRNASGVVDFEFDGPITANDRIDVTTGSINVMNGQVFVDKRGLAATAHMRLAADPGFLQSLRITGPDDVQRSLVGIDVQGNTFFGSIGLKRG